MAATHPVVDTTATSSQTASTSHTVTLPSGLISGDLCVICFAYDDPLSSFITGVTAGWTVIAGGSNSCTFEMIYRECDGTEGATITVTTNNTETSCHASYRISKASLVADQIPELTGGATGSSVSPNPDSISPTGGSKDYLFIACHAHDGNNKTTTGFPASYTNTISTQLGTLGGCGVGACTRQLTASFTDPGVFTISGSDQWVGHTIAIHPIVPSGVSIPIAMHNYKQLMGAN